MRFRSVWHLHRPYMGDQHSLSRTPACSTTEQAGSFFVCFVRNNRAFVHYVRIVFGHGFAVSSLYYRLSSGHRSTPAVDGFHFAIIPNVTVRCLNVSTQKVKIIYLSSFK